VQLRRRDMAKLVQRVLIEAGADPSWIILELTESIFADVSPEMVAHFQRLRDLGVGVSIDDFGTGYSSLKYLGSFPVSEIKLDRSFVAGLDANPYNRTIVEAVLKVGTDLDLGVTAEGVETGAECAQLVTLGCRTAQGYLFSRPVDEPGFLALANRPSLLP
jgi:EAL domain-containing protein (putative c-di-GMP-specific phosphodiesterase class I)